MPFFRSALYLLLLVVAVVPYAAVVLVCAPFQSRMQRYRLIIGWPRMAIWLAKHLLGIRYEVLGMEHIPARPLVILSKHQSAWETIFYSSIFPPHVYVMKRELLWLPFLGWGLMAMSPIAIDRANRKEAMNQLVGQGTDRMSHGFSIMIFPEGTRIPVGKRGHYRRGGAILAANTGADVLPVAHNAGLLWPRNAFVKKSGTVTVMIGPVIRTAGRTAESVMREAENWIEGQMLVLTPGPIERIPTQPPAEMQFSLPFLIETPPSETKRGRERYVLLQGKPVAYSLRRSARRTIGISVDEHGLQAAAPRWVTIAEIEAFIVEKQRWVLRHLAESRRNMRAAFVWEDGARIPYLGGEIRVRAGAALQLRGDVLEAPADALRENVIAWLKTQALDLFRQRVAALAELLRVAPPSLGLSQARTQWGNCARKADGSARVLLNWKLVHYAPHLIDYVVAHELAHLRHMNHSAAFWREVGRAYPDYLAARRELRDRAHWAPDL